MLRATACRLVLLLSLLALAACSSGPSRDTAKPDRGATTGTKSSPAVSGASRPGAYYKDDGPGDNPPDLDRIPEAQPRPERLSRAANNPYQVFGKNYVPMRSVGTFRQRGIASWYGRRYHGQKTSSGEVYDMYAMTAAHTTLPIPSYARVTNVANGKSVVVRINDRGPFHSDRVMDLSYVAAYKLGYVQAGSATVDIESLPSDGSVVAAARPPAPERAPEPARQAAPKPVQQPVQQSKPVPAEPAPVMPVSSEAAGVYLQLGAFSMRDNAEAFRAKVYKELTWLNEAIQVNAQGGLFRLRLGPYKTQEQAREMADRIRAALNLQPVLLVK